jgi:hypothetical protein
MIEDVTGTLDIVGTDLEFDAFTVKGIPGFSTSILVKGEVSLYEVEVQNFTFQVSTLDCINNDLVQDLLFTIADTSYSYTFKVDRPPINDLTGWSKLHANYVSKEAL